MPVSTLTDADLLVRATGVARRTWSGAEVGGLRRLEGGVSSLTYAARVTNDCTHHDVVLKIAPPGLEPVRNRDVLRQARVLDLLSGLDGFPVPAVLFRDAGEPPEVPPMFGMELVAGESYEPLLDTTPVPPTAEVAAERFRAAVRALARLHAVTPADLGVADEPVSPVREELDRWVRLFATVDDDICPGHQELSDRLVAHVPADGPPRLLHGDYRVANMMFDGPRLTAVIDWEIWSVGDPRSDLAWLLMHTAPAQVFVEDRSPADVEAGRLVPSKDDLVAEYVEERRQLGASEVEIAAATAGLDWFLGVCFYKVASTVSVIWKRERKSPTPSERMAIGARHLPEVLAAGLAISSGLRTP